VLCGGGRSCQWLVCLLFTSRRKGGWGG
jgi:hypothetical protein